MSFVTFAHSGTIGDVFASLPAIREGVRKSGMKAILLLKKDVAYSLPYENAPVPTKNENGEAVMLSEAVISMMIPLLKAQYYIEDVRIFQEGDAVDVNLDDIRTTYVAMGRFPIQRNYFLVFPQLTCNLCEPWLTVPETEKDFANGKIIISRTERYLNQMINYSFLKEYQDDILFSGTMREYNLFTMRFGLNIRKLHIKNFLELAQAISQCKFFLSNQTMGFQIAEGLKVPRVVELFDGAPDVTPFGENGYDFLSQTALEYHFKTLGGYVSKKASPEEEAFGKSDG